MNNTKLGNFEAIALILTIIINHTILNLPKALVDTTRSSTILNLFYVSIIAIIIATVIYRLFKNFPGLDLLDISSYLGGNFLKILIGILFFAYFIISSSAFLRCFCNNLQTLYYPWTSIVFIILLFVITLMINGHLSFNATIRSNLFIIPIVLISVVFLFIANIQNFSIHRIFPLLGEGFNTTFFSGISNLFAFGGLAFLYFIPPYLKETKDFHKVTILSIILSSLYLLFSVSTLLFMFNSFSETSKVMPLYDAVRYIDFGTFFQRLDAIFLLIWIMSFISYLSIVTKFSLDIFKKLSNIKNEKNLVFPISLLILAITLIFKNTSMLNFFENILYKYVFFILVIFISISVLIFANIKKRINKKLEQIGSLENFPNI